MGNSLSNENPALAEIKKQWSDVDDQHLIVPSLFVQDNNPFYRLTGVAVKVDIHERGAVFPLQSEKTGTDQYGKDVWEKTYYLSKMTIDRFAAAAGVSFVPANSGTMVDVNGNITGFAQIMLLAPDGGPRYVNNVKNIDLQVVRENLYKNKKKNLLKWGLSGDEGKLAAKQYKGEWKKDKYKESYFIDQSDVEAFLQAHVNQAMVQESKSVHEKAYTGAYLRAVRTALGINASYTESQLKKPFIITRLTFKPDFNDPQVRQMALRQGFYARWGLFGGNDKRASMMVDNYVDVNDSLVVSESGEVVGDFSNPNPVAESAQKNDPAKQQSVEQPATAYGEKKNHSENQGSAGLLDCVCADCGKKFHASTKYVANVKQATGKVICPECAKKAKDAGKQAEKADAEKSSSSSPYLFKCEECGAEFDMTEFAKKNGDASPEKIRNSFTHQFGKVLCTPCIHKEKKQA